MLRNEALRAAIDLKSRDFLVWAELIIGLANVRQANTNGSA